MSMYKQKDFFVIIGSVDRNNNMVNHPCPNGLAIMKYKKTGECPELVTLDNSSLFCRFCQKTIPDKKVDN